MSSRRTLLKGLLATLGALGAGLTALPFIRSLQIPKHRYPTYHDVDLSRISAGETYEYNSPFGGIYVLKRTPEMILGLATREVELRDPHSLESRQPPYARNKHRSMREDIFVTSSHCTHLGCAVRPIKPEDTPSWSRIKGGLFLCPCHTSSFDLAGRVVSGVPAKTNLEIPEYEFLDDNTLRINLILLSRLPNR